MTLQEELQKKFGGLGSCNERYCLEDEYLKENYPEMFKQENTHNFAKPLIEFFEKCWNEKQKSMTAEEKEEV